MIARHLRSLALFILTLMLSPIATADPFTDAYCLPLIDPYAIYHSDNMPRAFGPYQLVEVMPSSGFSTHTLIENVEVVATHEQIIFGKSAKGFFIFNTRQPNDPPQLFPTREEWQSALSRIGITDSNAPKSPDTLAAGVPDHVLRPWNYRVMANTLGLSDSNWSLAIQLLCVGIAFSLGLFWPRGKSLISAAALLGIIINIVAQIIIAGGGPGALAGFFGLPLMCMLAAALGKGSRTITRKISGRT